MYHDCEGRSKILEFIFDKRENLPYVLYFGVGEIGAYAFPHLIFRLNKSCLFPFINKFLILKCHSALNVNYASFMLTFYLSNEIIID